MNKELKDLLDNYEKTIYGQAFPIVPSTHQLHLLLDYIANLDQQVKKQKEFIEYMTKTIEECNNYSKYIEKKTKELHVRSCGKTYIANEIMKNEVAKKVLKEIFSKYKEITGVSDEK